MMHSKTAIWSTQRQTKGGMRATHRTNLNETFSEPHCQTHSAKEVTGLGEQLTEGKANFILTHLGEKQCRIQNIRLP